MNQALVINCLADIEITRHAIINRIGFHFHEDTDLLFEHLQSHYVQLNIRSLFYRISRDGPFNSEKVERKRALDNGLSMLRAMVKHQVDFYLIDSRILIDELGELKDMSPPLFEICKNKLINNEHNK